jgi:hypothetical protein
MAVDMIMCIPFLWLKDIISPSLMLLPDLKVSLIFPQFWLVGLSSGALIAKTEIVFRVMLGRLQSPDAFRNLCSSRTSDVINIFKSRKRGGGVKFVGHATLGGIGLTHVGVMKYVLKERDVV